MTDDEMITFNGCPIRNNAIRVTAKDYSYVGHVVSVFQKKRGHWRCIVEDDNGRLFIHSAEQLSRLT